MISVDNLTKSYGPRTLFEGVTFTLNRGERVGLVGRNGHGKSTLMRIILGREQADAGTVSVPKSYRSGYVEQHIDFTGSTVLEEAVKELGPEREHEYWKVEKILSGLGFSVYDMQRRPGKFSGGYQVRINLAKILAAEPDLLLLDEPTNYLDITSIRWLEEFLVSWPRELILITHDRGFMDRVVTHTMGIHRTRLRKIEGKTEKYYRQLAQEEEIYEKTRINEERRRKDLELFISRFRAKARLANLVQSRVKLLEKQKPSEKLQDVESLEFAFDSQPFSARYLLTAQDLSFGYTENDLLIRDFSLSIAAGERIFVVGQNGRGKTTLLKLLAGGLRPKSGSITFNPNVRKGFFEQTNVKALVDSKTVYEEILHTHENVDQQRARNICGAMMFEGDDAFKKIAMLSGGERSRVLLGKILVSPVNLLLLDEPTNHLDMESCDALMHALEAFDGAVVMVTHNEMILNALAERLVVFQQEKPFIFEGGYDAFLRRVGWGEEEIPRRLNKKHSPSPENKKETSKKEIRRKRSEIIFQRSRVLSPLEQRMHDLECAIENQEAELNTCADQMQEASQEGDAKRIARLSVSLNTGREQVDRLFDELEKVTSRFEQQKAHFDKLLEI